jgi:hypothetical protein
MNENVCSDLPISISPIMNDDIVWPHATSDDSALNSINAYAEDSKNNPNHPQSLILNISLSHSDVHRIFHLSSLSSLTFSDILYEISSLRPYDRVIVNNKEILLYNDHDKSGSAFTLSAQLQELRLLHNSSIIRLHYILPPTARQCPRLGCSNFYLNNDSDRCCIVDRSVGATIPLQIIYLIPLIPQQANISSNDWFYFQSFLSQFIHW